MILHLSTSLRNARLDVIRAALDAGTDHGYIEFYTGPQPAGGADITTQTLLGTCTLSKPCGTVSGGVLTFDPINDDLVADDSGTVAWARFKAGDGTYVIDADCGDNASTAVIKFNTTTVVSGGAIKLTSGTINEGNS